MYKHWAQHPTIWSRQSLAIFDLQLIMVFAVNAIRASLVMSKYTSGSNLNHTTNTTWFSFQPKKDIKSSSLLLWLYFGASVFNLPHHTREGKRKNVAIATRFVPSRAGSDVANVLIWFHLVYNSLLSHMQSVPMFYVLTSPSSTSETHTLQIPANYLDII